MTTTPHTTHYTYLRQLFNPATYQQIGDSAVAHYRNAPPPAANPLLANCSSQESPAQAIQLGAMRRLCICSCPGSLNPPLQRSAPVVMVDMNPPCCCDLMLYCPACGLAALAFPAVLTLAAPIHLLPEANRLLSPPPSLETMQLIHREPGRSQTLLPSCRTLRQSVSPTTDPLQAIWR